MNILLDKLPSSVEVGGTVFDLETDYRAAVKFSLLIEKGEENIFKLCEPFFPKGFPAELHKMIEAVLYFYRAGEEKQDTGEVKSGTSEPAYSFDVDRDAIYADFWRYYNIDLSEEYLHWWTFRSLLMGLPEDSNFKMRIYYRKCELKDLPKKEKQRISKIRKEIKINTVEKNGKITLEQRNNSMLEYVKKRSIETG